MTDRLKQFIHSQGLSVRAFEQSISASDGMIRRAINNNTDIQSKWIAAIADNYPCVNLDWLITGHGSMLREDATSALVQPIQPSETNSDESVFYYKMYKEEKAENKALSEEIGVLKHTIKTLEEQLLRSQTGVDMPDTTFLKSKETITERPASSLQKPLSKKDYPAEYVHVPFGE